MPNIHETIAQLQARQTSNVYPEKLVAQFQTDDSAQNLGTISPIPTGWNVPVENPGDRELTDEEREFNTELARHQGGAPSYATVSQGADINISPPSIYSKGD